MPKSSKRKPTKTIPPKYHTENTLASFRQFQKSSQISLRSFKINTNFRKKIWVKQTQKKVVCQNRKYETIFQRNISQNRLYRYYYMNFFCVFFLFILLLVVVLQMIKFDGEIQKHKNNINISTIQLILLESDKMKKQKKEKKMTQNRDTHTANLKQTHTNGCKCLNVGDFLPP